MSFDSVTLELPNLSAPGVRRIDIDEKQHLIAQLLHETECEGLLVLHPANFRWLTSGANPVGLFGRDEMPGLFFTPQQRWLLASSVDSPRFFVEELDTLGFMLKEWHWTTSREQMLTDLVYGRKIACDQPFRDCKWSGSFFIAERRRMTVYEEDRLAELGKLTAHAVEATARTFQWGDSEEEIAGHMAHRLLRHGVEPLSLQVSGDGRAREHRRRSFSSTPVERVCILQATGRKFGLHVTVSRSVSRTKPEERERAEFEAALRLRVTHLIHSKPGKRVWDAVEAGKNLLKPSAFEHEWLATPPLMLTGREPSEGVVLAGSQDRWAAAWAAVWQERIGAAAVVDTYLISIDGWRLLTTPSDWPIRRAVVPGREFDLADLLVRGD